VPAAAGPDKVMLWRERIDQEGDQLAIGAVALADGGHGAASGRKQSAHFEAIVDTAAGKLA